MITSSRFWRLCLVMVVPLLVLGWWLSKNEKIVNYHIRIGCFDAYSSIDCVSTSVNRSEAFGDSSDHRISINGAASLAGFFVHDVVRMDLRENLNLESGKLIEDSFVRGGPMRLTLPLQVNLVGASRDERTRCNISGVTEKVWLYNCVGYEVRFFEFAREADNKKFREATREIVRLKADSNRNARIAKVLVFFLPIFSFLVLAIAAWVLKRVFRFVMGAPSIRLEGSESSPK